MRLSKTYKVILYVLLSSILLSGACEYFYHTSPRKAINKTKFQTEINTKQDIAGTTLESLKNIVRDAPDSLIYCDFRGDDISYYLYENGKLSFWSNNHIDIESAPINETPHWQFTKLSNAFCLLKSVSVDSSLLVAVITIKYNYPYENEKLTNSFAKGFQLDKRIGIAQGSEKDKYAVFDTKHHYLCSLVAPEVPVFNNFWGIAGFIFGTLSALLFLFLYAGSAKFSKSKQLDFKTFGIITVCVGIIIGLSLYFNLPSLLYWNELFSSFEYSSNPFLSSISHLTIATLFFLGVNYLFFFHVNTGKNNRLKVLFLQILFVLYFLLTYNVLSGIIFHSSIQLTTLQFKDITLLSVWLHILILFWGIGLTLLFYKTHNLAKKEQLLKKTILNDVLIFLIVAVLFFIFSKAEMLQVSISLAVLLVVFYLPYLNKKRRSIYRLSFNWVLIFTTFFFVNSILINHEKNKNKYRILAENIHINGNMENDQMAEILLEELDTQIVNDKRIRQLSKLPDSIINLNEYLNENYLRGFWNKYDMHVNIAPKNSEIEIQYSDFINRTGDKIKNTHFYSVPASYNAMSYLGVFRTRNTNGDIINMYMEFYPRKNFRSYSFPNLLMTSAPDIQSQLKIAVARYENNRLIYSTTGVTFPNNADWITAKESTFFTTNYKHNTYYVYNPNENDHIVIVEAEPHKTIVYVMYFAYTFLAFYTMSLLVIWFYIRKKRRTAFHIGLTTKFQYMFIVLLILSFLGILYVSVNFIQQKYQDEQINRIEGKKSYIQNALQEMYYWSMDLSAANQQGLNFNLQELSYMYQTDIHVYDNRGMLVGSSQPLIFNKNLISRLISPKPHFTDNTNINQDEHIGTLNYLSGYTELYNGDYLQIGYIAIPQFYSKDEIRNEIESFLAVIIHIYLIIIILTIILSLLIGKQLSAPLKMIENKLKQMRFGERNSKIDYQVNDEIGQLVTQYNRTLDELEKSAQLLAQSERESAWRTMAKQIAHEINNPLTPMKLTIQQLQRTKQMGNEQFDDYFDKSTHTLIEQIDNLSRIAGTFSNFARMPEARFEWVDVAARLHSVVQLFIHNHEQTQIQFEGEAKGVFVLADGEQLTQVFNNLLKNAIQSIPAERKGLIRVKNYTSDNEVVIEIEDNGRGIADEVAHKMFVPNFTTKSTGTGLGLTITKNIIEMTGGQIAFTTRKNKGTTFIINLPKAVEN